MFLLDVLWVAHRGIPKLSIENTIESFQNASMLPFFGIECDVHLTKDKKDVIHHDTNIKRLTGIDLEIKNTELKKLNEIDFSFPNLTTYLDICKKSLKWAIIELKVPFSEKEIEIIYNKVKHHKYLEKTIFISFYRENLLMVRKVDKYVKLQYLTNIFNDDILNFILENKLDINFHYQVVNKEIMEKLNKYKIEVNVFTVNNLDDAKRLIDLGVKYITTDGI